MARQAKTYLRYSNPLGVCQALLAIGLVAGCGSPGAPSPPSLNLPIPAQDLSAVRTGNVVRVSWTSPLSTTDHLPIKKPMTATVYRQVDGGPFRVVAKQTNAPGAQGQVLDTLSSEWNSGPVQLLTYKVELLSPSGKSGGNSNLAYSASGTPPPAITGLSTQLNPDGVLLKWQAATRTPATLPGTLVFQIDRQALHPAAKSATGNSERQNRPASETLEIQSKNGVDPGRAIDASIAWNQEYRYILRRVERMEIAGHAITLQGEASEPVTIETRDVFPPAKPQGLTAGPDEEHHAVDLSWTPNSERDLAGYYVYRRDEGSSLAATRISPPGTPITEPSFRDTSAMPGHIYAYSISAVDGNGNESPRSTEITERLPDQSPDDSKAP